MGVNDVKTIKFYIKIYFMVVAQYLKERLQFRADFIISIFGMILINLSGIATFWVIFKNINVLAGWSYEEVLFLYGFALIAMSLQQLLLDNAWRLSYMVVTGNFIRYCFRPVNILFYYMSEIIDVKGISQFGLGTAILIWSWSKLSIPLSVSNILMFILLMFSAILICMALMISSSALGFMGGGTNALMFVASDLKGYGTYPLTIFNKFFRTLFTFIMPIGFIAYYPAQYFLRTSEEISILTYLSPIIGVVFFYVACKIWITCANRYSGTGS